ncbi:unknown similar to AMEV266 [Mythimna separata entomopoxvirus 'L']|uniref:Transcription factor Adf-1 n=1 Tax=Mythimna separata entomopoxvirus 'L' TaxID=1293572 RepID=A0A916KQG6_9POXV|nr:unknown similar to AMEV266 [Mythimna separata entomopoxvirus 'L']CCU56488.1 unknown similar to AMEV266 [Mythimna separata entomopoxvirus 'L']
MVSKYNMDNDKIKEIINFIYNVKNHPCLYNTNIPEYTNNTSNRNAWNEIAKKTNYSIYECRYKWRKIRVSYIRSIHRQQSNNIPTRRYYLENYLRFLRPYIKLKYNSNKNDTSQIENMNNSYESEIREPTEEILNNIKIEEKDDSIIEIIDDEPEIKNKEVKRYNTNTLDNPRKMFILSLLPDVENFTESEMRYFRKKIIKICDNIEYKRILNKNK